MATRTRAEPTYEDFEPVFEWMRNEKGDTLIVVLPGFLKEHLSVQLDSRGNLRIRGERPLGGNKWSRFLKEFQLPENCNVDEVRAQFVNDFLRIFLPKFITQEPPAAPIPVTPEPKLPVKPQEPPAAPKPVTPEPKLPVKPQEPPAAPKPVTPEPKLPVKPQEPPAAPKPATPEPKPVGEPKATAERPAYEEMQEKEKDRAIPSGVVDRAQASLEKYGMPGLGLRLGMPNQLIINVVVALLVILALGVYVTYYKQK